MLEAGGGGGLVGAMGVQLQARVAGDLGPGGEGAGLALLEAGEQLQVGFGALLVGAEEIAELDEPVTQEDGPQVGRDGPLCGLPLGRAPGRRVAESRHFLRAGCGRAVREPQLACGRG